MGVLINIAGRRFGRLLVIKRVQGKSPGLAEWQCRCSCGNIVVKTSEQIRKAIEPSCGCAIVDRNRQRFTTHGMRYSSEYGTWCRIKERCYNKNFVGYKDYGGRGIQICAHWRNSFANFYADMGPCPPGLTLDRVDNDKGYVIGNCRWATVKEQARNRRSSRWVEAGGLRLTFAGWVEKLGTTRRRLRYLLDKKKISMDVVLRDRLYKYKLRGVNDYAA